MAGSLSEIRPGVYKVRVYVGTVNGRDQTKSRTFTAKNRREAERLMHSHVAAILADRNERAQTRSTINGLVDDWHAQRNASPTTLYRERSIVARIRQQLGHIDTRDLTVEDVDRFYSWLRKTKFRGHGHQSPRQLSESTIHHHYRVLHSILNTGQRWDRLDRVPTTRAVKPKRTTRRIRPPADDDLRAVLESSGPWAVVFVTLAKTGMRRGELCHLRWTDLRAGRLWVHGSTALVDGRLVDKLTKTGEPREVELDEGTQRLLQAWRAELESQAAALGSKLAPRARLFPDLAVDHRGLAPIKPDTISQAWRRIRDRHGLDIRLHDLRHWHASSLLAAGVPLADVQHQLGHAQMSTTANIYAHRLGGEGRIAQAMSGALTPSTYPPLPDDRSTS